MSSADLLRRAAEHMRATLCYGGSGHQLFASIADWWDLQAERLDGESESMVVADHPALVAARAFLPRGGDE